jgi:YgiT-type zinc finger domain-containing protein
MRCVICNSPDIEKRVVEEEIHLEQDIVLVPIEMMVCLRCGERYYDRRTMRFLEEMEAKIVAKQVTLHFVGQVLKMPMATEGR